MNPLRAVAMSECLVAGQTYQILSAKRIPTQKGLWLFVKLHLYPQGVLCRPRVFSGGLTYLFTDHQIDRINNGKLWVKLSYFGLTLSGDPIIQIRHFGLPSPFFEDMAAAGILFLK
jgi:hypothetical protein